MIAISQLLQVLQGTATPTVPPDESGVQQASGGLAKLFGAMLAQARGHFGEQSALPEEFPGPATSLVSEAVDSGETENQEVVEQSIVRPPNEQAASILGELGTFEGLQIEHAVSAFEGLSKTQALLSDESASVAGTSKALASLNRVSTSLASAQVVAPSSEEAASVPGAVKEFAAQRIVSRPETSGQVVAPSSVETASVPGAVKEFATLRTVSAPEARAQIVASPLEAPPEILHFDPVLLESGGALSRRGAPNASQGLPPAHGLVKAIAEKMASPKGQVSATAGQNAQVGLIGDGEGAPRVLREPSTLHEMFARAVTKQHVQAAPKQGAAGGPAVTGTLELLEPLLAAAKAQAVEPGKALMPPVVAEAAKVAQPPPVDAVLAQAATERPPPEVVQVRDAGQFIVKTVRYLAGRHEEVVTVRLVPRSLGEMQIAVSTKGNSIEIVITAASQVARDTIEAQISGLREALARDGSDVAKVTVQTFTPGDQGPGHSGPGNSATSGHAARHATKFTGEPPEPETGPHASPKQPAMHEGSLNMLV